jgi:N-acetylmuramoyl-L-alanine amidase
VQQAPPSATPATIVAVPASSYFARRIDAHPTNYRKRTRELTQAIVLHATDGHEGPDKAEDVARMFAGVLAKPRSCHFVADSDSLVQCVPAMLTAWHCGHTGNMRCEGLELCGFARQTPAEWLDALSLPMLNLAARHVAERCRALSIAPVFVDRAGLRQGLRGITTHAEVSLAWQESTHTDPGRGFPLRAFIDAVRAAP